MCEDCLKWEEKCNAPNACRRFDLSLELGELTLRPYIIHKSTYFRLGTWINFSKYV